MVLPTSIWVKFKNTYIRVTYLGVVHDLVFVASTFGGYGSAYLKILSGNLTTGTVLTYALDEAPEFMLEGGYPAAYDVRLTTLVDGAITDQQTVGTVSFTGIEVTGVTGAVTAAEIVYRSPLLPKLLRLPVSESYSDAWEIWMTDNSVVSAYSGSSQFAVVIDDIEVFTGTFALDANNVGTTDCPFVDWIGELSECVVKATPESATWTVPAGIDLTKPVIAECWGSGASGGNANADEGAVGGGGGGYASMDIASLITALNSLPIQYYVAGFNEGIDTTLSGDYGGYVAAVSGSGGYGGTGSYGDVYFSGGDGASGQPDGGGAYGGGGGSSAAEFANGNVGSGQDGGSAFPGSNMGPGGTGANIYDFPAPGSTPGGGGGGGYSDGDQSTGANGADGLIRFHYALQSSAPSGGGLRPGGFVGIFARGMLAVGNSGVFLKR